MVKIMLNRNSTDDSTRVNHIGAPERTLAMRVCAIPVGESSYRTVGAEAAMGVESRVDAAGWEVVVILSYVHAISAGNNVVVK